jgi:16S rRNA (adenine1518-N6/adenine1519-N6)-dimethyltransferase
LHYEISTHLDLNPETRIGETVFVRILRMNVLRQTDSLYKVRIMNKTEARKIVDQYGLHPNKRLGQNFLVANDVRNRIIDTMNIAREDHVLEVGPGLGALTERLVEAAGRVTAVEIDSGFYRYLLDRFGGNKNINLIHGDFLKVPPDGPFTKIVSNLPYYCSSEILFTMAGYEAAHVYVMLQKELSERIAAKPGTKNYGALSVTLAFYYHPEPLFKVSRESFYPKPEVTSAFITLNRRGSLLLHGPDIELFHNIVKSAFWGRRKTILTAMAESPHLNIGREKASLILEQAGIDGRRRGEELDMVQYVSLVKAYGTIFQ